MRANLLKDEQYYQQLIKPVFLLKDRCIFYSPHYNEKNYQQWKEIEKDKARLERTINHVHLKDLVDNYNDQIRFGKIIEIIWRNKLKNLFPGVAFDLKLNTIYIEGEKELILDLNVRDGSRSKVKARVVNIVNKKTSHLIKMAIPVE